jgi:hypothetical protein
LFTELTRKCIADENCLLDDYGIMKTKVVEGIQQSTVQVKIRKTLVAIFYLEMKSWTEGYGICLPGIFSAGRCFKEMKSWTEGYGICLPGIFSAGRCFKSGGMYLKINQLRSKTCRRFYVHIIFNLWHPGCVFK